MNTYGKIQAKLRLLKLRYILGGSEPSADRVERAVDEIIEQAHRDEAAGVRKDRVLFSFESMLEEISDDITLLRDRGCAEEYKGICEKLYVFALETMRDSYMPLYLYILYRYAQALLDTGETLKAEELFRELYNGTERLIGINNPYGIHCLERCAVSAARTGDSRSARRAVEKMRRIAAGEFGQESAMMMAVERFSSRLMTE